jgi:hypothetical protein
MGHLFKENVWALYHRGDNWCFWIWFHEPLLQVYVYYGTRLEASSRRRCRSDANRLSWCTSFFLFSVTRVFCPFVFLCFRTTWQFGHILLTYFTLQRMSSDGQSSRCRSSESIRMAIMTLVCQISISYLFRPLSSFQEGYGYLQVPLAPGTHHLKCVTWKPTGTTKEEFARVLSLWTLRFRHIPVSSL